MTQHRPAPNDDDPPATAPPGAPPRALATVPVAPGRLPALGHLVPFMRNPMRFITSLQPVGPLVRIDAGPMTMYLVNSPALLHQVLVTDARRYEKGAAFDKARTIMGNGVLFSEEPLHLQQRRLVQPAFRRGDAPAWRATAAACAAARIGRWREGQSVDVLDEMHRISLTLIIRSFFATDPAPATLDRLHRIMKILLGGIMVRFMTPGTALERLPIPSNRRFNRAVEDLNTIVADMARAGARTRQDPGNDRRDLFATLCPAGAGRAPSQPLAQTCDEAISVLIAGTETMATTLSWLLHELAQHPDWERQLRAELRAADGDTGQAEILDRLLSEVLRLHTPNWVLMRRARTDVELGGVHLPAGTELLFSLSALHRDPQVFDDASAFDPDRWLPGRETGRDRFVFIPFGDGNRKCLGDAFAWTGMREIAAELVTRWSLRHAPGATVGETRLFATLQPTGLRMTVAPAPAA
ncbi:cytochrome P450 [Kitasatospora sp. NPDC101183]|uniref:cytochrome P450 n=1 Tax=Kitasatospora sp. NPDC101183 TaxID=3364100 RepID=UPI003808D1F9